MSQAKAHVMQTSVRTIHEEHASLAAMLRSSAMMVQRGPQDQPELFFDVMRAMLFYMDEFAERLHHTKESELLFPLVAARSSVAREVVGQLDHEHVVAQTQVREMQHLLLAWELLGDSRRDRFEVALKAYVDFYLQHMRLEETVILTQAQQVLDDQDWKILNNAFGSEGNPLSGKYPREPLYDRLFTRITTHAPAPIGLGMSSP